MSIASVAKRAGVSVATVSRVLNDFSNVREETAQQVRTAMQEMGYTAPQIRRGPKSGRRRNLPAGMRTGQIGVMSVGQNASWLGLPVMAAVIAGIMRAAKEHDIRPVLDEMPELDSVSPLIQRREVDAAILFVSNRVSNEFVETLHRSMPVLWVMGGRPSMPDVDHVAPDNRGIGDLAYRHLAGHGCRDVAFIGDHPEWPLIKMRGQAFAEAAILDGVNVTSYLVANNGPETCCYPGKVIQAPDLERLVDELVRRAPRPVGLFVPTDNLTTMLYPMLAQRGIVPGRDVRIVSCDREAQRLGSLTPAPVSIDLRAEEIGRAAVRQLVQRLSRPNDPPVRIRIAPTI